MRLQVWRVRAAAFETRVIVVDVDGKSRSVSLLGKFMVILTRVSCADSGQSVFQLGLLEHSHWFERQSRRKSRRLQKRRREIDILVE